MSSTSQISIPANAAVGGISFTQPPTTTVSYFKIAPSIPITFGWNFTSLYVQPSALTLSAFCSSNQNHYPVGATDGIIPGTATSVVWEPWTYQTANGQQTPLVQGTYTLQVQDERGSAAPIRGGFFSYNEQMTFALYTPQPYTPLSEWVCAQCNAGAGPLQPHPAVFGLVATIVVMLISGWSVLRNMADRR